MLPLIILTMGLWASPQVECLSELPEPGFILSFKASSSSVPKALAPCVVIEQSGGERNTILLSRSEISLSTASPSGASGPAAPWSLPSGKPEQRTILLTRYEDRLRLAADNVILAEVEGLSGKAGVLLQPEGPWAIQDLRVQPVAPLSFSDDFMRTQEGLGDWTVLSGDWIVRAVEGPSPELSASPFALKGASSSSGALVAGYWFWNDFTFQVAVRSEDPAVCVGLILNWVSDQDYTLLRWSGSLAKDLPGRLALFRVSEGNRHLLKETRGALPTGRWIDLQAAIHAGTWVAGAGGIPALKGEDPLLIGGQVGLYVEGGQALFDDVSIQSVKVATPLEEQLDLTDRTVAPVREKFVGDAYMNNWSGALEDWVKTPPIPGGSVQDYSFYSAPADWHSSHGHWTIAPRWICRPDFSFMRGDGEDWVSLWHDWRFSGDMVVEAFCANGMSKRTTPHYERNPNRCLSICTDGEDPLSGYTLVWGGPDFPTRLVRKRTVVAEYNAFENPVIRKTYKLIIDQIHRNWTDLRLEKKGSEIKAFVDGQLIGSFVDPDPLEGGTLGLWAWNYSLTLARVRIVSRDPQRPDWTELTRIPPSFSDTGPIKRQKTSGPFKVDLVKEPFDPQTKPGLLFEVKSQPGAALSLVVETDAGTLAGSLSGPSILPKGMVSLKVPSLPDDAQWHPVRVDVLQALKALRPDLSQYRVTHAYLADLEGNSSILPDMGLVSSGSWVGARDVRLSSKSSPASGPASQPPPALLLDPDPRFYQQDFNAGGHAWRTYGGLDGATPYVFDREDAPGDRFVRALNLRLGGCFGLVADVPPYDLGKYPWIAFDCRMAPEVNVNLIMRIQGVWEDFTVSGLFPGKAPLTGSLGTLNDGKWHRVVLNVLQSYLAQKPCRAPIVDAVAFGERGSYTHMVGDAYDIDNFQIFSEMPQTGSVIVKSTRVDASPLQAEVLATGSDKPVALPAQPDGGFLISGLAPGSYEVRVKPAEGAGDWVGRTTIALAAPVVDAVAPVVSLVKPAQDQRVGDKTVSFVLTDKDSGVDFSSVKLKVAGQTYDLASKTLKVDPCTGECTWEGNNSPLPEGPVSCELFFADVAGNWTSEKWSWIFLKRLDGLPPRVPHVTVIPMPFRLWQDFEQGPEEWVTFVACLFDWGEYQGAWDNHSLLYEQFGPAKGSSAGLAGIPSFSARDWPMLTFDVCLKTGGPHLQLEARVNNEDVPIPFDVTLKPDEWTSVSVDIAAGLVVGGVEDPDPAVEFLTFQIVEGGVVLIDNVCQHLRDTTGAMFLWNTPDDATGVRKYRLAVDEIPKGEVDRGHATSQSIFTWHGRFPKDGYLHLQALDGIGNWGPVYHHPLPKPQPEATATPPPKAG